MARRHRDTSRKRAAILDAAAKAFIADGYDKASMDRIAEIADASKRTVYNHFASKEELFRAVLAGLIDEALTLKRIPYDGEADLEAQLGAFADVKIRVARDRAWMGMMKVAVGVCIRRPALMGELMARAAASEDGLVVWLRAAAEDGRLKIDNPERAAEVFWAMMGGAFFWPSLFQAPADAAETRAMKSELLTVFLARYGS